MRIRIAVERFGDPEFAMFREKIGCDVPRGSGGGVEKRRSSRNQTSPSAAEDRPRREKPRRVAVDS